MPSNAWEDDDEGDSPLPPLHERAWRHPSELGCASVHEATPVRFGVGLTITAGLIACAMSAALVWMLTPVPTASPASEFSSPDALLPRNGRFGPVVNAATRDTALLRHAQPSDRAVAVIFEHRRLMITTTNAVDELEQVDALLPSGESHRATVVQTRESLAFLRCNGAADVGATWVLSPTRPEPGDVLTVLTTTNPFVVTYLGDGKIQPSDDRSALEGSPLINGRGELVALLTRDHTGISLVPVTAGDLAIARSDER